MYYNVSEYSKCNKMKKILFSALIIFVLSSMAMAQKSFYDFRVKDINGQEFDFSTLKGKKVLIVNTASKCGYTPQYEDLEKLYNQYKSTGFVIIGFPANDFMKQEPGTNEEIAFFCKTNYGVSFPMMSKVSVKGPDQDEIYKWLTSKEQNGVEDSRVSWNFQKYMINRNGTLYGYAAPSDKPYSEKITEWLKNEN